jgi:hypothetical protein
MKNTLLSILSTLVFMPALGLAAGRQVTVITSLPFTISSPGIYVLDSDLTVSGSDAIDVNAPDVVINFNGYSIIGSSGGIGVSAGQVANVIVENGRISGFTTAAVQLGPSSVARNLVGSDDEGIDVQGQDCVVQNCILQGTGTGLEAGAGIGIESSRCEVTGCRVAGFHLGIASFSENDAIIHNFVTNCHLGLSLRPTDCYQGNVATGCTKAFSTDGIAVGQENGHN